MSTDHTQGKLVVRGTRIHDTQPGIDCIASMQVSNQPSWEEDAHRLVACWNACEGIADPENVIPHLLELNEINPVLSGQVATLRKQNAELVATLIAARRTLAIALKSYASDMFETDEDVADHFRIRQMDAVIAKAEGGTP